MSLKLGLVGLPNAGKSTLFNALTGLAAKVSNFPFTTIDPNHGIVPIPDSRPEELAKIAGSKTWANSTLEIWDMAGLIKDSHKGAGLGNQFLDQIRRVDLVLQVVRAFEDPEIVHPMGLVNPQEDIEIINYELCLADLAQVEKSLEKAKANPEFKKILEFLKENLGRGISVRHLDLTHFDEAAKVSANNLNLITAKPLFFVVNVAEGEKKSFLEILSFVEKEKTTALFLPVKFEADILTFSQEEAADLRKETGFQKNVLEQVLAVSYQLLNLVTFLTFSAEESKSWAVKKGTTALEAAAKIHSDMAHGFIKAEVIPFEELKKIGSLHEAHSHGKILLEGKNYHICEGDVLHFKFSG